MTLRTRAAAVAAIVLAALSGVGAQKHSLKHLTKDDRMAAIRRAQVWEQTDVASADIKAGPAGGFSPDENVSCEFDPKKGGGNTPKFWCEVSAGPPKDVVKVKYGEANGEVYAEVAATRLLWALGFGADHEYPVKVLCRGCGENPFGQKKKLEGEKLFDPASIERPFPGKAMETAPDSGWSWVELNSVDQTSGGAPLAQRDALKLLAVFIQHTDSKPQQQRLVCRDSQLGKAGELGNCAHPFMMINDLGVTFGKANTFNSDNPGSVNLKAWTSMPIWKGKTGCVGNLPKSFSGSLENPQISEAGRAFLANLLGQLSDQQIHDLFEVARFTRRDPKTTVDDWVNAFKQKRDEIASRSCGS